MNTKRNLIMFLAFGLVVIAIAPLALAQTFTDELKGKYEEDWYNLGIASVAEDLNCGSIDVDKWNNLVDNMMMELFDYETDDDYAEASDEVIEFIDGVLDAFFIAEQSYEWIGIQYGCEALNYAIGDAEDEMHSLDSIYEVYTPYGVGAYD